MRRCADSITPGNLPAGFDLYAGYDDGRYMNVAQIKAIYPTKLVLAITVFASDAEGDVLDVENGDATPQQAPVWVQRRRLQGHPNPGVYCSEALWSQVQQAFRDQKVPQPWYWVAAYPGPGPVLYPGSLAHQYQDVGPYDVSVFADYIPGIDPAPTHATKEGNMIAGLADGKGYLVAKADGSVYNYGEAANPTSPWKYNGGINNAGPNGTSALAAGDVCTGITLCNTGGYWLVTAAGHVYAFGGAPFYGGQ
jgi:hypothetical protein